MKFPWDKMKTLRLRVEKIVEIRVNPDMTIAQLKDLLKDAELTNPVILARHGDVYVLVPDNVKIRELSALPSKYELIAADIATIEDKTKDS